MICLRGENVKKIYVQDDLPAYVKNLEIISYDNAEYMLSYALRGWKKTSHSSSTELMGELERILKQFRSGNSEIMNQVEECLRFLDEWFHRWNMR
jgi:hypothetical protein